MENCGTLQIRCNKDINFALFDFGISQPNSTSPYIWGGTNFTLPNGDKAQKFNNLGEGLYTWFVRKKNTTQIINTGSERVICNAGTANIKTFYFSNIFQSEINNYTFDMANKKVILLAPHRLYDTTFTVIGTSFNGVVLKFTPLLTAPNLPNFDEVVFTNNRFDLSALDFLTENIFSVTVSFN